MMLVYKYRVHTWSGAAASKGAVPIPVEMQRHSEVGKRCEKRRKKHKEWGQILKTGRLRVAIGGGKSVVPHIGLQCVARTAQCELFTRSR